MPEKLIKKVVKRLDWKVFEFLAILVILILRVVLYRGLPDLESYLKYDEAIYAMLSQKFLNGEFNLAFHPYWNSGFPLINIPFYTLTGSWEQAQILVSIVSHILLVLVMYITLRRISLAVSLIAAFFTAFSPSFTKLVTAGGVTEPFYILLFWLAVYFGWQTLSTGKTKIAALAGLFFGLAYLTRTEVIYTLGMFLLFLTLSVFLESKTFPSFSKFTLAALLGGGLAYLYIPFTKLPKFTTFKFNIFYTTRGIFFALPFIIAAVLSIFFKRNKTSLMSGVKRLIPIFLSLLIVFLLVNLPYVVTISKNLGKPTLSGKYSFIGSAHPFTPEKDRLTTWAQDIWSIDFHNYSSPYYDSGAMFAKMWKFIDHALEATWKRLGTNLDFLAHDNVFSDFEALLIMLGFTLAILQEKFRKFAFYLFVLWLGSFVFVSHFMDAAARYLAFSFPLFYFAQAVAVIGVARLFSKIRPNFFPWAAIIFAIWYFDKNFDTKSFTPASRTIASLDQKIIGDYLKSESIDLIMARTEGVVFYANAKIVYLPAANPETIIKFAKAWGVEYLLARPTESSWDYMRPIADPGFKHPDLVLKHKFEDGSLVWQVKLTQEEKLHNFRTDRDVNQRFTDINVNSQTIIDAKRKDLKGP